VGSLTYLPCDDSDERASKVREQLWIDRYEASGRGREAVEILGAGAYHSDSGGRVDLGPLVQAAVGATVQLEPDTPLPAAPAPRFDACAIQVVNDSTLSVAQRLTRHAGRVLALNMANGVAPGGGFLGGARAQEETLAWSSGLHATLDGSPMYEAHRLRADRESSDYAILSPDVPVFRDPQGSLLDQPWLLDFITCAAPVATHVGQPRSAELLGQRIRRVLDIAATYGYSNLVLGAWGCGAFGNDPVQAAKDFHHGLREHAGHFENVIFAISDWSPERKFLGPFCREFAGA
jgi:uncharacterized protein (TIGR02452 family)